MKSREEAQKSVLAYCQEKCPLPQQAWHDPDGLVVIVNRTGWTEGHDPIWMILFSGLCLNVHQDADCRIAYRVLGLGNRDERDRSQGLMKFVWACATRPGEMVTLSNDYSTGGELIDVVDYQCLQEAAQLAISEYERTE